MKKGLNSSTSASNRDLSLPRARILRGRKNFQQLFDQEATLFREEYVNLRFRVYAGDEPECLMGFIVPRKLGKAVRRNRAKRLLREAYRINQHLISDPVSSRVLCFHGAFMANQIDLTFEKTERDVVELLTKTRNYILSIIDR